MVLDTTRITFTPTQVSKVFGITGIQDNVILEGSEKDLSNKQKVKSVLVALNALRIASQMAYDFDCKHPIPIKKGHFYKGNFINVMRINSLGQKALADLRVQELLNNIKVLNIYPSKGYVPILLQENDSLEKHPDHPSFKNEKLDLSQFQAQEESKKS